MGRRYEPEDSIANPAPPCPFCRQPTRGAPPDGLVEVTCPHCDRQFRLVNVDNAVPANQLVPALRDWTLRDYLGSGPFGTVWTAQRPGEPQSVRLKVAWKGRVAGKQLAPLRESLAAVAALEHPLIPRLHHVTCGSDGTIVASELVGGTPLSEDRVRGPWPPERAAQLVSEIARALQHAHDAGVTHGNLKPSNILLRNDGQPCLLDFGLAESQPSHVTIESSGRMLTALGFVAPERLRRGHARLDPRSDVYSLGILLFQLLTGELPFRGAPSTLLRRIARDDPPSPRRLDRGVPRRLATLCLRCLEKRASRRFGQAGELADELQRCLRGNSVQTGPLPSTRRTWRWLRWNSRAAWPLGFAISVSLLLAGLASVVAVATHRELRQERARRQQAEVTERRSTAEARQSRQQLYAARIDAALRAWEAGRVGDICVLLDACRPQPGQPDLRGFEWHHLWKCSGGESRKLRPGYPLTCVQLLSGSRGLVTGGTPPTDGSSATGLTLWNLTTGAETSLLSPDAVALSYAPATEQLATADTGGTLRLWDLATGQQLTAWSANQGRVLALAFTRDATQLVSGGSAAEAEIWDLTLATSVGSLPLPAGHRLMAIQASPDGQHLAIASAGDDAGRVGLWTAGSDPELRHAWQINGADLAFSPSGDVLAVAARDLPRVEIFDVSSGSVQSRLWALPDASDSLCFLDDDTTIVTGDRSGGLLFWDARTGRPLRRRLFHGEPVQSLDASGQPPLLVSAGETTVKVWDLSQPSAVESLAMGAPDLTAVRATADGSRVSAVAGFTHTVLVRDLPGDDRHTYAAGVAAYLSPDGKWLAMADNVHRVTVAETASHSTLGLFPHPSTVKGLALSADGDLLACLLEDAIWCWNVRRQQRVAVLELPNARLHSMALAPNGRLVAAGATLVANSNGDATVEPAGDAAQADQREVRGRVPRIAVWHVPTGRIRWEQPGISAADSPLAFSPDGTQLAHASRAADGVQITIRDTSSPRVETVLPGHPAGLQFLGYSPDGQWLVSGGGDRHVRVWRVADGHQVHHHRQHGLMSATAVAFAPDGRTLALADGQVRLVDLTTGELRATLSAPAHDAQCVAWSTGGQLLVAGSRSGLVTIWRGEADGGRTR
jgi:WD40 repeat protein